MSEASAQASPSRRAIVDALRIGAPGALDEAAREAFLTSRCSIVLADLGMDSLGEMEFCIAIELATGVTLVPSELTELRSTDAIEQRIREKQDEAARSKATSAP